MTRALSFLTISLLLATPLAAQTQNGAAPQAPGTPAQADPGLAQALAARTCPLPQIADSVPLVPAPGSGSLMLVPVKINNTDQTLLLDIGLKRPTTLSPDAVAKLGLPEPVYFGQPFGGAFGSGIQASSGWSNVRVIDSRHDGGQNSTHDRVSVGSFSVGDATGRHMQMLEADKGVVPTDATYSGYLTGSFFAQYDVEVDVAAKRVTWLTQSQCTDPNQAVFWSHDAVGVIPVSLAPDGRYQMKAMARGHVFNAEIDTSSPVTIMRRDIADEYLGLKSDTDDMKPVDGLKDGHQMQIYLHVLPELIFAGGNVVAQNVPLYIQDYSLVPAIYRHIPLGSRIDNERIPDLTIGMDVLKHLHMYFVPGQGRVLVTAAEPSQPVPPTTKGD